MVNNWIEWNGGECPVPAGTLVDLRYRDNYYEDGIAVPALTFGKMSDREFWQHGPHACDIIAWRLHQPEQPAWNGEGLPPVGTECELFDCDRWKPIRIKYVGDKYMVANRIDAGYEIVFCFVQQPENIRPIRTEAERKREGFIDSLMKEWLFLGHDREQAGSLYDAIAAGKIPGVKLED